MDAGGVCSADVEGAVVGVVNVAHEVNGIQIGLINKPVGIQIKSTWP